MKRLLVLVAVVALPGIASAADDPEYQKCSVYGSDVHNFIDCLVMARDGWDSKTNRIFEQVLAKANDAQRKPFYALAKKQVAARNAKCGSPNPSTVAAAECQRAITKEQHAEFEKAAAAFLK